MLSSSLFPLELKERKTESFAKLLPHYGPAGMLAFPKQGNETLFAPAHHGQSPPAKTPATRHAEQQPSRRTDPLAMVRKFLFQQHGIEFEPMPAHNPEILLRGVSRVV
jgi:hypothetical protein